jgi:site-specific DNA recombinase
MSLDAATYFQHLKAYVNSRYIVHDGHDGSVILTEKYFEEGANRARTRKITLGTRRRGRLYRYYITMTILKQGAGTCPLGRVPAAEVERAVIDQLRQLLAAPELIVGTWRAARPEIKGLTESDVRDALMQFEGIWDELFPAEQARIVQLLVERVDVGLDGLELRLRTEGLCGLIDELRVPESTPQRAA